MVSVGHRPGGEDRVSLSSAVRSRTSPCSLLSRQVSGESPRVDTLTSVAASWVSHVVSAGRMPASSARTCGTFSRTE